MELTSGRCLLIDLMPILYRGYFVFLNKPRRTAAGINTSSLSVFVTVLEQMIRLFKPTHLAIAMESRTPTFRHRLFPAYKAQREKMPEDIADAILQANEVAEAWGLKVVHMEGYEADDILGTLADRAAKAGLDVIIATPDKDLGQLAGPHVRLFRPGEKAPLSAEEICAQWNIAFPAQLIDYLALAGDVSDNIPGVSGVGPKTATRLIQTYGSVENLLAHAEEIPRKLGEIIRANRETALLSKQLVTIVRDIPLALTWDDLLVRAPDTERLTPVLRKYELNNIAHRLGISLAPDTPPARPSSAPSQALAPALPGPYKTLADLPHDYRLVETPEARAALAELLLAQPAVAFDTETTGLNPRHDRAVGCSFAIQGGRAWYLPLPEDPAAQREALAPFIPLFTSPHIIKIGHNLKFDRSVLARLGLALDGPCHDTLLAHYLLSATDRHDLDHVANVHLSYAPIPLSRFLGHDKSKTMAHFPPAEILDYAAEDADVAFRLDALLREKLAQQGLLPLLEACEEPLASVLLRMEQVGVRIDPAALRRFRNELEGEIIRLEMDIRTFTGAGINLASPKQVGEFLFGELALDPNIKRTSRGQFPTNEELLLKLRDRHPVIDLLLDWRACVKLKNTYVDRLPEHIDPTDGRVHTTFNQTFTDTGRLSSSDPNLQNIPIRTERGQRIRAAIVSRGPGWQILSADYSQVELRLLAAMSGDPSLLQAFHNGEDIHARTASIVYGIPLDQVSPQQRSHCKMVNFGILYGISSFGLASRLRIPRKDAQALIDNYFTHYPTIRAYLDKTIASAREKGYAQTLFGRRRQIPEISSRNATTRAAAERVAVNMPIQGTAADIIKYAMVRIDRELRERALRTQMILQIHDELLFDVPDDELPLVRPLIQEAMESVIPLPVPLQVSIGIGPDWLSAH